MIVTNWPSTCIALSNCIVTQGYIDQQIESFIPLILSWQEF